MAPQMEGWPGVVRLVRLARGGVGYGKVRRARIAGGGDRRKRRGVGWEEGAVLGGRRALLLAWCRRRAREARARRRRLGHSIRATRRGKPSAHGNF